MHNATMPVGYMVRFCEEGLVIMMLKNGSKFYFSKLADGEKNLYANIADALGRFEPALSLHAGMGKDFSVDIEKILHAVFFDNPGYFYLDRNRIVIKATPMYLQLCFQYDYTQEEAAALSGEIKETLARFMCDYIEPKMSPLAKQLAVYKYLQSSVTPQQGAHDRDSFSIVGALIRRACVCEGFSKAYKLFCDYLRIASVVVRGDAVRDGVRGPHAWNITRIGEVTAHCDITWDTLAGIGAYDYFNLCDADMAADHAFDSAVYPPCAPNKINYFYKNGLIAANDEELKKIVARNRNSDSFSVKLLFPVTEEQLPGLGFPGGTLRHNKTQNIIMFHKPL